MGPVRTPAVINMPLPSFKDQIVGAQIMLQAIPDRPLNAMNHVLDFQTSPVVRARRTCSDTSNYLFRRLEQSLNLQQNRKKRRAANQ